MRRVGLSPKEARQPASLWGVSVAVLAIVAVTAFFIDRLNDYAQDYIRAEALLFSIEEDAAEQHIAAVEALGGEVAASAREVTENRREIDKALDALRRLDPDDENMLRVGEELDAYEAAIDEHAALIERGRMREAEVFERERVDESFEALHETLEDTSAGYETAARRAALVADLSTYASILLAAIALTALLLYGQREQASRVKQEAERRSQERFRSLVQNASDIILILGADQSVQYVSPAIEPVLGYKPEVLIGKNNLAPVHPDDMEHVRHLVDEAVSNPGTTSSSMQLRLRHADGSWRWIESRCTSLLGDPAVGGIVFNSRDITDRKRAEERATQQAALLEQTYDAVFTWQLDGGIVSWNEGAQRLYGWSKDEALGQVSHDLLNTIHPFRCDELVRKLRTEGHWEGELVHYARDGRRVVVESRHILTRDDGFPGFVLETNRDVTERKMLEEQLEHRAFHDGLTGLPNRTLLAERLEQALARSARRGGKVAVLFVDIDDFKNVNDSLGHWAGDEFLAAFARRLEGCVRPGDTVARFGGDEFVVLLESVAEEEVATEVARRMIAELGREPFVVAERAIFVTSSIGIALGGYAGGGWEDLLRRADLALHRAKKEGKARHAFFTPDLEACLHDRLKLEGELRLALERGEFRVLYQPKVSIRSGEIVGMEALVRWEHPERGLLAPSVFLSPAEETGLIVPMGRRVLEVACRQVREWQKCYPKDPPLAVSVNLSAKQFQRQDLPEEIGAVLRRCSLDPCSLTLEITEETAMKDVRATTEVLGELKAMGVRIEVDDFGTGYSSLSYLKRFPVDYLKIDRSFVAGLGRDPEDEGIVGAVVELAYTLGLTAVAEGVENGEQLGLLREMGCELAQGYYFWKPLPAEAAGELLAAYNTQD